LRAVGAGKRRRDCAVEWLEHVAQNGGTIRETFDSHWAQRYSPLSTGAEQIVHARADKAARDPRE